MRIHIVEAWACSRSTGSDAEVCVAVYRGSTLELLPNGSLRELPRGQSVTVSPGEPSDWRSILASGWNHLRGDSSARPEGAASSFSTRRCVATLLNTLCLSLTTTYINAKGILPHPRWYHRALRR